MATIRAHLATNTARSQQNSDTIGEEASSDKQENVGDVSGVAVEGAWSPVKGRNKKN